MRWPFESVRLLQARLRDLEAQLVKARDDEQYFRSRYERLADAVLLAQGVSAAPVHVAAPTPAEPLGSRIMRIGALAGSHTGVDFSPGKKAPHASAADLP